MKTQRRRQEISKETVHQGQPDVILDFVCEGDLLFVELKNIGDAPAINVKTKFDQRFTGINGEQDITKLAMFRLISFLTPSRDIRTFIDSRQSYFSRKQPDIITATLQWTDRSGKRFSTQIIHDLRIYKDLITVSNDRTASTPMGRGESWQNNQGGQ